MAYKEQLLPWCVVRLLPESERQVLSRFRRRSDADAYLRAVQRSNPILNYNVVFDQTTELVESTDEQAEALISATSA